MFLGLVCLLVEGAAALQTAPGLFVAGLLLSAKAGWMLYAVWHAPNRYCESSCAFAGSYAARCSRLHASLIIADAS